MRRRDFLRTATSLASATVSWTAENPPSQTEVALVIDHTDSCTSCPGARWTISKLKKSLQLEGFRVRESTDVPHRGLSILVAGANSPSAQPRLEAAQIAIPKTPESYVVVELRNGDARVVLACGADERGVSYAVREVPEVLQHAAANPIVKSPTNAVRSVMRQFTSELLDKPWFYDRDGWQRYLDLLATNRWNRLDLTFGLGYDNLNRVDDSYFLFFYPFVVFVPGYKVYATNLPDAERDLNLATLQFIGEQTTMRGMDFQLGLWMHGYQWRSGRARNTIQGLSRDTHAPYCRDALALLLKLCPSISSVGLRIHGESGIAEGSYDFWATIFDGVKQSGRTVEIDLHAKGIDERMIDNALATGMPVNVSPKYSAEHFGLPYHQAAIREMEMPVPGHTGSGLMSLSEGSRVFTRYGYADLLKEDRKYTVRYRVFAGTQRILLWDDPAWAAAYSEAFRFCGSKGVDLMEPLTCRGRRGSATPGTRTGYADAALEPRWDWQKYASWYQTWGQLLYDSSWKPDKRPDNLQIALANASRILPIVTNAYLPSAACDAYWPEIYWNQAMAAEPDENPYADTAAPKVFQNASPLDPQLFLTMNDFADQLLSGDASAKYSPVEVALWLERFVEEAEHHLRLAGRTNASTAQRGAIDITLQTGLGRFFACKFRAGVLYALFEKTNDHGAIGECLKQYRGARQCWAAVADLGGREYGPDLSVSDRFDERGQWRDRLAGIDSDIAALTEKLASAESNGKAERAVAKLINARARSRFECRHTPPVRFQRGESVILSISPAAVHQNTTATLHYRRVNQAERFQSAGVESEGGVFRARIPAAYSDSPYPLQYYFEFRTSPEGAYLYPGFDAELTNEPYFVVTQT